MVKFCRLIIRLNFLAWGALLVTVAPVALTVIPVLLVIRKLRTT